MCPYTLALSLSMLISASFASHFWGGLMTFSPKGMYPNGSYQVEFRYKQTFEGCGYLNWKNTISGIQTSLTEGVIYNGRTGDPCQTEGILTKLIPTDNPLSFREQSCCWESLRNSVSNWRLLTVIDLGNRSDTNKPNRSPVTTITSFVSVPQNCPRTYQLVTFDPDGDQGRCRIGALQNVECSVCQVPSGFTLSQTRIKEKDFCTLSYTSASTGSYGFELVVEDFPQQNIRLSYKNGSHSIRSPFSQAASPLSKLPLHFVVKVDSPIASCEEGVYLPKFIPPTPENGDTIQALVNQELKIIVNATASVAGIHGLVFSGPLNITNSTETTHGSTHFVLKWTPRSEDLGEYFPICFIAESNLINSIYYQSEMRCVIVEVRNFTDTDSASATANKIVAGLRMTVESDTDITETDIEDVIKLFREELIRNGLPNTTTLSLRQVHRP